MAPPHGYRQPYVSGSIWSLPGAYVRIFIIISYADSENDKLNMGTHKRLGSDPPYGCILAR
jgi:hypothetical protein